MIRIDYNSILSSTVSLLTSNNTATNPPIYDLSSNMSRRIQSINQRDPEISPTYSKDYPALFVRPITKTDEWDSIGNSTRRANLVIQIDCLVNKLKDLTIAEQDLWYLMRNVETVMRGYPTLNNYSTNNNSVLVTNMESSEFKVNYANEGVYQKSGKVNINMQINARQTT